MTTAASTDLTKLGHAFAEIMSSHDIWRVFVTARTTSSHQSSQAGVVIIAAMSVKLREIAIADYDNDPVGEAIVNLTAFPPMTLTPQVVLLES